MTARCLIPLCAMLLAGCEHDTGLRLEIELYNLEANVDLDSVVVDVVAVQGQLEPVEHRDDYLFPCRMATKTFDDESLHFPIIAVVRPGDIIWDCVGVRARGFLGDVQVIRNEEQYCFDLDEDVVEETLVLDQRCLESELDPPCTTEQVCVEGACNRSLASPIFSTPPLLLESCESGDVEDQ